jgi:hypothetical protein
MGNAFRLQRQAGGGDALEECTAMEERLRVVARRSNTPILPGILQHHIVLGCLLGVVRGTLLKIARAVFVLADWWRPQLLILHHLLARSPHGAS